MADNQDDREKILKDKIDELESLINSTAQDRDSFNSGYGTHNPAIPILDEVITAEDYDDPLDLPGEPADGNLQLEILAERLEQKFSAELDEIVSILKGNLRENILNELRKKKVSGLES